MARIWIILLLAIAGCEPSMIALPAAKAPGEAKPLATAYDATATGTVTGIVRWNDPKPMIPQIDCPLGDNRFEKIPNPNMLHLDENNNLAGAVVMLRGVDPAKSKPWPFAPVEVELHDRGISVHQGERTGRAGFVHRGDSVTFRTSGEKTFGLRARGDAFFALILPLSQPQGERTFPNAGRVELSSASGQYWAGAELYVCDHPYYAITDSKGAYHLENVPPGTYELVVEHPNWNVIASEIDPETSLMVRQTYGPVFRQSTVIAVHSQLMTAQNLALPLRVPPELK